MIYYNRNILKFLSTFSLCFCFAFAISGQAPIVISFDDPSAVPNGCNIIFTEEGVPQQLVNNGVSCSFEYSVSNGTLALFPATLSVDLSGFATVEKVEVVHIDFCGMGCSQAALLFNGTPIITTSNTIVSNEETMILDNSNMATIDELTISSFEGFFSELRIFVGGSDPCANSGDSDDDGICDDLDACPGFDDMIDRDGNGIPDYCDICQMTRTMMESSLSGDDLRYEAIGQITSSEIIRTGADITFDSGGSIDLVEGFEVELGATFTGLNFGCGV